MSVSIFLAKYFGIYFLLVSSTMLFEPFHYKNMIKGFRENDGLTALGAIVTLMLGLFLVLIHTVVTPDWRLLITVLCWMIFLKGWLLFAYPKKMLALSQRFTKKPSTQTIVLIIYIVIALYLIYCGFFRNA